MGMIDRRIFMLQLCTFIVYTLVENNYMEDNEDAEKSVMVLAKILEENVNLPDYSFCFNVTDNYDKKKYIA